MADSRPPPGPLTTHADFGDTHFEGNLGDFFRCKLGCETGCFCVNLCNRSLPPLDQAKNIAGFVREGYDGVIETGMDEDHPFVKCKTHSFFLNSGFLCHTLSSYFFFFNAAGSGTLAGAGIGMSSLTL
jgi:hypothetical protein